MAKKRPVRSNCRYVIAPADEITPFRDWKKAVETAKDQVSVGQEVGPLQVIKVEQSWVIEVPETPEPTVEIEDVDDILFYDDE